MSSYGSTGQFGKDLAPGGYAGYQSGGTSGTLSQASENLRNLKSISQRIESMTKALNTPVDTTQLREELKQNRETSISLIKTTMVLLDNPPTPAEKAEYDRLVKDFSETVGKCKEVSQASIQKERAFPPRDPFAMHYGINEEQRRAYEQQAEQITIVQAPNVEVENKIIDETNKEMHKVHSSLVHLKGLAEDTRGIVESQSQFFVDAEKSSSRSVAHSSKAVEELKFAMKHQSNSRKKQLCIIVLIVGMVVIVALIIALFVTLFG